MLLGQGQTAQVLRNLCLLVYKDAPADWDEIVKLMARLFAVQLGSHRKPHAAASISSTVRTT